MPLAAGAAMLAGAVWPAKATMEAYRWENRPLVVFAPDSDHPIVAAQRDQLEGQLGALRERDIVVIEVIGRDTTIDGESTSALEADTLRQRYRVNGDEAAALLIGKDGGVKIRQPGAISADRLFETIDAMPMRRREMQEQAQDSD